MHFIKPAIEKSLYKTHPNLIKEWHPTKNGDLTPKDVSFGSENKVWWICRKGHEWEARICDRSKGIGCLYCSNRKVNEFNCLAVKNPTLAKEWHPVKNGILTPYNVVSGSSKKVWWLCSKGHEWQAIINNRNRLGRKCPYCANQKITKQTSLAKVNPKLAREWHPTKNNGLTPYDVFPNKNKQAWWLCKKGHEWQAKISNRNLLGRNCPYCTNQLVYEGNCLKNINPKLSDEWHPTKNNKLTPKDVTASNNKKVWWICKKGHEWQATIHSRNIGGNCPYCSNKKTDKNNCLATRYPNIASEWHPTKNGKLTPKDVVPGSGKKVWWQCHKGHEWITRVEVRVKGSMCPACKQELIKDGYYKRS